jgi:AmmeMemoRadiSam system protein B/AmmeMemoRadiSam system protein A
MPAMAPIRPAAVAGMFYPGDARALAAQIGQFLASVEDPNPRAAFPKALVVPHAGYVYSGAVAARAYDELVEARGVVRRVVLLGPVHRVPVRGLAAPGAAAFETPLGSVAVDEAALRALHDLPQVVRSDAAHALEHSLEVQLPFLQAVLGEFALVPLAVGTATVGEVAEVLERLWGGTETLIVISTDLSHYHAYEEARRVDASTLARISALATDIDHDEACGATPLNGLLSCARRRALGLRLLAACNSGDTAGGMDRVVGYSSFALDEVSQAEVGATLLQLARAAIEQRLLQRHFPETEAAWLARPGATFVTLLKNGELRGCIGSLHPARSLAHDVAENALGAAFRDPRFKPLTADEWPQCTVEVSLLSAPRQLRFADERELLSQIRAGDDGLILEAEGRRGTFLPQVWEAIPDKRSFLAELVHKAGLPADTPLAKCAISRYRVAKFDGR